MIKKLENNVVYSTIKDEILFMDLLPGAVISETEIAKRFDVSRTPVREAFQRLEYDGLVEIKSHLGTFITLIDLNTINDVRFMREQVELEVLNLLMNQSNGTLELKLKLILEAQKKLFESDLSDNELARRFVLSDNEFHRALFESANKLGVWNYLQSVEHHYERLRVFLNIHDIEYLYSLYEDHEFILKQIGGRDWDDLQERYQRHLTKGLERGADKIIEYSKFFKDF